MQNKEQRQNILGFFRETKEEVKVTQLHLFQGAPMYWSIKDN